MLMALPLMRLKVGDFVAESAELDPYELANRPQPNALGLPADVI
jgi:hypothetical protein